LFNPPFLIKLWHSWIFNFALGYFVPPAFVSIKWRTYCVFGAFLLVMFLHVFFFFPEVKSSDLPAISVD